MTEKKEDFSKEYIQQLANDPTTKQLIRLLSSNPQAYANAVSFASSGNYKEAVASLGDILSRDDVKLLLKQLGGKTDGSN